MFGNILLKSVADSPVCFRVNSNMITYNPIPHMFVPIFWFLHTYKHNENKWREEQYIQQLRIFEHKGKRKIGCYPISLLLFTSYQVHDCWNMILSSVKAQPDGRKVKKSTQKIMAYTYKPFQAIHMYSTNIEESPRWILYLYPLCLGNHTNIQWYIFT